MSGRHFHSLCCVTPNLADFLQKQHQTSGRGVSRNDANANDYSNNASSCMNALAMLQFCFEA